MTYILYSYYDRVSGVFSAPFCECNDNTAKRRMLVELSKVPAQMACDYDLYQVGTFSTENGSVAGLTDKANFVCHFTDLGGNVNE